MSYHISPTPRADLYSTATQSFTAADTANALTLTGADITQGFTWSSTDPAKVNVIGSGDYLILFGSQFQNSSTASAVVNAWLNYNGTDTIFSNSVATIPGSTGTPVVVDVDGHFINHSTAGAYFQIMGSVSSTLCVLAAVSSAHAAPEAPALDLHFIKCSK